MVYPSRSPDTSTFMMLLAAAQVHYVLVGSVAASLYGVPVEPGDFDLTPDLELDNLLRLKIFLERIGAKPSAFGHWTVNDNGEKAWVEDDLTADELRTLQENWTFKPDDISSIDHLFTSKYGNLDVVPELAGNYTNLCSVATRVQAFGNNVRVAHIDDLLATLTVPRRPKDKERVAALRQVQRDRHPQRS